MRRPLLAALIVLGISCPAFAQDPPPATEPPPAGTQVPDDTYSVEEITKAANDLFGATTEGLAKVIEKAFAEQGRPNAYIVGEEGSGAVVVGLRYGSGTLTYKVSPPRPS